MDPSVEAWGWAASGCVLAAFAMRRMRPLRVVAIASNIAFLVYAAGLGLLPVLLLHAALLPLNLWRLWQDWLGEGEAGAARAHPAARCEHRRAGCSIFDQPAPTRAPKSGPGPLRTAPVGSSWHGETGRGCGEEWKPASHVGRTISFVGDLAKGQASNSVRRETDYRGSLHIRPGGSLKRSHRR